MPLISGDPGQLHQVVMNVVVNAAQAIDAAFGRGGVQAVAAYASHDQGRRERRSAHHGGDGRGEPA